MQEGPTQDPDAGQDRGDGRQFTAAARVSQARSSTRPGGALEATPGSSEPVVGGGGL